ncbi:right-handed parallel beta-helix repeat-containing protein [Planctomonas deserti]|uniref:right-handed parallel beta-helix repeat-containing protein n=1 Tax=Planctomonas deserti TaxID=2144185 RepID=UPI000D3D56EE|nr:right-handed parallel beta-helix repeat-containing protein [Planctomonas deserti]
MRVRAELTRGRLVVALLLVAILPALLAFGAVLYDRPAPPPGPPAYNPVPLARQGLLTALQSRELARSRRVTTDAALQQTPWLEPPRFPERLPTIGLTARPTPYTLPELATLFPTAIDASGPAVLVSASIEVANGAQLAIDGTTPDVRLLSAPDGFAAIIARGGGISITGDSREQVRLSSWDPARSSVDSDPSDGRSFLLTIGGRMDIANADIGHLGFGTGSSSGAAWRGGHHTPGLPPAPAEGDVTDSVLHHNWFGAYTFEAEKMQWVGNTFANNSAYGFDPHDLSNDFLVEDNIAHGNGRHGFIFSRGCERNVLRNNIAYDNRGHGFMIDDGRSVDSPTAEAARLPSNDNLLVGNHAHDNDGTGIELEGGTGTVVEDNLLERNHVGIRVKDQAAARVSGNTMIDNALAGIDVLAGVDSVQLTENTIEGGWAGIALGERNAARLTGNEISGSSTVLAVEGEAEREESIADVVGRVFRWNPMLVLWVAILGVPTVVGVRGIVRAVGRRRTTAAAS